MHRTNHIPLPKFSIRKFSHHLKFDRVERVSYAIAKNMIAFDRERRGGEKKRVRRRRRIARFGKFRSGAARTAMPIIPRFTRFSWQFAKSGTIRRDRSAYINNISLCERAHRGRGRGGETYPMHVSLHRVLRKCIVRTQ